MNDNPIVPSNASGLSSFHDKFLTRGTHLARAYGQSDLAVSSKTQLHAEGDFVFPELVEQGLVRRLSWGAIHHVTYLGNNEAVVITHGGAMLVDVLTGTKRWTFDCPNSTGGVSKSGRIIALVHPRGVIIRDNVSGLLRILEISSPSECYDPKLSISADERYVAAASQEIGGQATIEVWDLHGSCEAPEYTRDYLGDFVAVGLAGQISNLVVATQDLIEIVDWRTDEVIAEISDVRDITAIDTDYSGKQIGILCYESVTLWDFTTNKTTAISLPPTLPLFPICLQVDEISMSVFVGIANGWVYGWDIPSGLPIQSVVNEAVVGFCNRSPGSEPGRLWCWNNCEVFSIALDKQQSVLKFGLDGPATQITGLQFGFDSYSLLLGSYDGWLGIWDTEDHNLLWRSPSHNYEVLASCYDGSESEVVFLTHDGNVIRSSLLGDDEQGVARLEAFFGLQGHTFLKNEGEIVVSQQMSISQKPAICRCWDSLTGRHLWQWELDHTYRLLDISGAMDKALVLETDSEYRVGGNLYLYLSRPQSDVSDTNTIQPFTMFSWIASGRITDARFVSDNSNLVVINSLSRVDVLDLGKNQYASSIERPSEFRLLRSPMYHPSTAFIALSSRSGEVRLEPYTEGSSSRCFQGHATEVRAIAFSPDGNLMASGDENGQVRLWRIDTAHNNKPSP